MLTYRKTPEEETMIEQFRDGIIAAYGAEIEDLGEGGEVDSLYALLLCAMRILLDTDESRNVNNTDPLTTFQRWLRNLQKEYPDQEPHESQVMTDEDEYFRGDFNESVRLAREALPDTHLWHDRKWDGNIPLWAKRVVEGELYTLDIDEGLLKTYICLSID